MEFNSEQVSQMKQMKPENKSKYVFSPQLCKLMAKWKQRNSISGIQKNGKAKKTLKKEEYSGKTCTKN